MPPSDDPVALLRAAIDRSGLSARRFATEVMIRDERTIRRWLAGDSPIPKEVAKWLEHHMRSLAGRQEGSNAVR